MLKNRSHLIQLMIVFAGIITAIYYILNNQIKLPRSIRHPFSALNSDRGFFIEYTGLSGILIFLGIEMILMFLFLKLSERISKTLYGITPLIIFIALLLIVFSMFTIPLNQ